MAEHRRRTEHRETLRRTPWGDLVPIHQWRHVCSCGHATSWRKDIRKADREADRHAFDGQLSQAW